MQPKHLITLILLSAVTYACGQTLSSETRAEIENRLNQEISFQRLSIGRAKIDSVALDKKVLKLFMDSNFYLGFSFLRSSVCWYKLFYQAIICINLQLVFGIFTRQQILDISI